MKTFLLSSVAMVLLAASGVGSTALAQDAPPTTVVLVHGSFADGSSWAKVIPILEQHGLRVVAVQNPLSSLADDVDATTRAINLAPGPVVLVGHSWAGAVITDAGMNDKVEALVYVAAFVPGPGMSVNDLAGGQPPAWFGSVVVDGGGYLTMTPEGIATYFAPDLTPDEIAVVAATQGATFSGAFDEKVTGTPYATKPTWYVVAAQDQMIPPEAEAAMAGAIGATTVTIDSSHVVMLSHPQDVADVILDAVAAVQ